MNLQNFKNNFELKKTDLINCKLNQNILKYYVYEIKKLNSFTY